MYIDQGSYSKFTGTKCQTKEGEWKTLQSKIKPPDVAASSLKSPSITNYLIDSKNNF